MILKHLYLCVYLSTSHLSFKIHFKYSIHKAIGNHSSQRQTSFALSPVALSSGIKSWHLSPGGLRAFDMC